MPNIRQQEKRVRLTARQRIENLRWRSTAKTLMRRLRETQSEDMRQYYQRFLSNHEANNRPRGLRRSE